MQLVTTPLRKQDNHGENIAQVAGCKKYHTFCHLRNARQGWIKIPGEIQSTCNTLQDFWCSVVV